MIVWVDYEVTRQHGIAGCWWARGWQITPELIAYCAHSTWAEGINSLDLFGGFVAASTTMLRPELSRAEYGVAVI
jgi:hypothetical protein